MTSPCAFVHTDRRQLLPALVSAHALRTTGAAESTLEVRVLGPQSAGLARMRASASGLNEPSSPIHPSAPQGFALLRRAVPELMGYAGRALLIDPDIFALRPIASLFELPMDGIAIRCRRIEQGFGGDGRPYFASGCMLMDCAKLGHWNLASDFAAILRGEVDYWDLLQLRLEDRHIIGPLDETWNSLDERTSDTHLLHFTRPHTQPWMTGLTMDPRIYDPDAPTEARSMIDRALLRPPRRVYKDNPDPSQSSAFFDIACDAAACGAIGRATLEAEIGAGFVRPDLVDIIEGRGTAIADTGIGSLASEFASEFTD